MRNSVLAENKEDQSLGTGSLIDAEWRKQNVAAPTEFGSTDKPFPAALQSLRKEQTGEG